MALKAGYIGTGGISGKHLKAMAAMKDKVEITALCDVFEESAKARADEFGGSVYTDYKKMLDAEDLDIAFICVPPDSHGEIEVDCAEKGLHMLVEKPVNLYMDDAIRANEAIKKAGVVTSVGYLAGYSNMDRALKNFLADKTIGMVVSERWGGVAGGLRPQHAKRDAGRATAPSLAHRPVLAGGRLCVGGILRGGLPAGAQTGASYGVECCDFLAHRFAGLGAGQQIWANWRGRRQPDCGSGDQPAVGNGHLVSLPGQVAQP